ncbi:MAG: hypothetical protein HXY20_12480, partial [Acidobacteria bacterium]|nr:hypothetical protein [Acidobacteriota bacterium]
MIDGEQNLLTPGLIDLHTHGLARYRYDAAADHLMEASLLPARFGTTTVFPTLVPVPGPGMLDGLSKLSAALENLPVPCMPGLHLEGPFTALPGAGCATLPGDVGMLEELLAACNGKMAIMSLSPETPNILPVIERLLGAGVIPFVTHTMADARQTQAAIDAGARHATHFYDVFPQPPEKDPGVRPVGAVEAFLVDPRTT